MNEIYGQENDVKVVWKHEFSSRNLILQGFIVLCSIFVYYQLFIKKLFIYLLEKTFHIFAVKFYK